MKQILKHACILLAASAQILCADGTLPLRNAKLQNALDANGQNITGAGTVGAAAITIGGVDTSAIYQPLDATITSIASGVIGEDLDNTAFPWADNEVSDTITIGPLGSVDDAAIPAGITRDTEWNTIEKIETATGVAIQQEPVEGPFINGDKTKLDGIEALADVTDTANVTAAGALMDSEVTNLAQVKAFDSTDYWNKTDYLNVALYEQGEPARTEMYVAGFGEAAVNGTYVKGADVNGRSRYDKGDFYILWTGTVWNMTGAYESTDDVAEPDLVTTWIVSGGALPIGTVTPDYEEPTVAETLASKADVVSLSGDTTDATATVIYVGGVADSVPSLATDTAWMFDVQIVAAQQGMANIKKFHRTGVIVNDGGTTSIAAEDTIGTDLTIGSPGAWAVDIKADDPNDAIEIEVTGEAATNIRWVATLKVTEVSYP